MGAHDGRKKAPELNKYMPLSTTGRDSSGSVDMMSLCSCTTDRNSTSSTDRMSWCSAIPSRHSTSSNGMMSLSTPTVCNSSSSNDMMSLSTPTVCNSSSSTNRNKENEQLCSSHNTTNKLARTNTKKARLQSSASGTGSAIVQVSVPLIVRTNLNKSDS